MTSSASAEQAARLLVEGFQERLAAHHQVVDLSEESEPRVAAALDWLLATRHADGYWGYRSPMVTAVCCVAIAAWRPTAAPSLLQASSRWLLDQVHNGTWETTWDSAVAMQALYLAGADREPRFLLARDRLRQLDPDHDAWKAAPHHVAQLLVGAEALGLEPELRRRWMSTAQRHLGPGAGPYVSGQVVYALLLNGRPPSEVAAPLAGLANHLDTTLLSASAFLDHTSALRALALAGTNSTVVDRTIDTLFSSAYRRDGSWYHEPGYTAWALLALHEARAVRRVIIEQPRLSSYLAQLEEATAELSKGERHRVARELRRRWLVVLGVLLLEVGLAGLSAAVFLLPDRNRLLSSGIAVTSVVAVIGVAWRLLRPLLTADKVRDG